MTDAPNIVLIVLDTMRKDVLPSYGGSAATPQVDALADAGVVYRNCVAPSPWTVPSHASMLTGKYPSQHGVHESRDVKIPRTFDLMARADVETVVEYLRERGYNTIGFSANPSISPGSGFDNSFNSFTLVDATKASEQEREAISRASKFGKTRQEATRNLLKSGRTSELWKLYRISKEIERRERLRDYPRVKGGDAIARLLSDSSFEQPFFLFVNLFEMHEPYVKGEPTPMMELFGRKSIDGRMLGEIKRRYLEEAQVLDAFLWSVVRYLKNCGVFDDSLVVLTSDHGQELKENGFYGHGTFLHDEIVQVPLIVKYPGNVKPKESEGYQSLARIPELIKDCVIGSRDGKSLTGNNAISESFGIPHGLETVEGTPDFGTKRDRFDRPRKAIYQGGFKLVVDGAAGSIEEFSLQGQRADWAGHKQVVTEMLETLQSFKGLGFKMPPRSS